MSEKYIEIKNLSVGYSKKALIEEICLDIKRGEIVTLIGPNGAGKSTILKSITRQLEIIKGDVVLDQSRLQDLSFKEMAHKMAVVLTDRIRTELLTCYDIVATGRYPYTGKLGILTYEDREKVEKALKAVHASELGERDFGAISDGQRQRVLLARAICQEPDVIVLDEPTSFLDIKYKLELLSILRKMAKEEKITVVMSLHEIDLAQKISDKIVCVKGDRIFQYGKPEEIFERETIKELYEIDNGFYDTIYGSIELPGAEGEPKVFVISSGGRGIPVYRKLQKEDIPFTAGILYPGDTDYQLARFLAAEIIEEKPFCHISQQTMIKAMEAVKKYEKVIFAGAEIGEYNRELLKLVEEARRLGKLEEA